MPKYHTDIVQQSPEWFAIKEEYPLSSSNATAIANQGAGLKSLVWKHLSEKYSVGDKKTFSTEHTERGNELEPQARSLYSLERGVEVTQVGFITNDKYPLAGASTDGLVGEDGGLEIKSLEDKKHFPLTLEEEIPIDSDHMWQIQMELLITERDWFDYVLYNPNYKKSLLIKRVVKDEVMQEKLKTGIVLGGKLIKEIEDKIK
jgi:hypothetical protein